jgi:hypothetical protein
MSDEREDNENFRALLKYTLAGYAGGLGLGAVLDGLGYGLSAVGQWIVRTLSGEGESLFEGFFALRRRLRRTRRSLAEAYGWGKLAGMAAPWIIDWGSRLFGVNVFGVGGFYIPYFYALSDQIGANVSGFLYLKKKRKAWGATLRVYVRNAVMMSSLVVILAVPVGLLAARLLGFRPTTQVRTAAETMAANLCWITPLFGWMKERRERKAPSAREAEAGERGKEG